MPVARIVGAIGRVLVTAGVLLLLFVAYQLWGTGLAEARAQDDLRDEFTAALATTSTTVATTGTTPTSASPTVTEVPATSVAPPAPATTAAPPAPVGTAVAIIRIPRIGLDKAVVEGVVVDDLRKGPGHYPSTPLPGQAGNAAIAGHRTTYGAPFGDLGELAEGDEVLVTTRAGEFRYLVDRVRVVSPGQVEVLAPTSEARLTLTTCHPKYSARQRLVVSAVLATPPVSTPTTTSTAAPEEVPGATETTTTTVAGAVDDLPAPGAGSSGPAALDDPSLAGDPSARAPAASWAAVVGLVALAAWAVGRRWRRWPSYLVALPFGAAALFQCFEQVARLLPANI